MSATCCARVAVGAEREANARVDGAAHEALVRPVAIRDLERDAGVVQRAHDALLARLGPQLVRIDLAQRRRDERRMREDVHRHLRGERLERRHVRLHVRATVRARRAGRDGRRERSEPFGQTDGVQRADAMREASHRVGRELTPERVVPAELAAAQHVVLLEIVEILRDGARRIARRRRVARDVVGHARPHAERRGALDDFGDGERAVGVRRVRVAVDRLPRHRRCGDAEEARTGCSCRAVRGVVAASVGGESRGVARRRVAPTRARHRRGARRDDDAGRRARARDGRRIGVAAARRRGRGRRRESERRVDRRRAWPGVPSGAGVGFAVGMHVAIGSVPDDEVVGDRLAAARRPELPAREIDLSLDDARRGAANRAAPACDDRPRS